jgi:hypothetical protein
VALCAGGPTEDDMQESVYKVQWILSPDDPERAGIYGTTSHHGASPAAAAIASAQSLSQAVDASWGRAQLFILRVYEELCERDLLSGSDFQAALRRSDHLPLDVVYRPIC